MSSTKVLASVEDALEAYNYGREIGAGSSRRVFHIEGNYWAYKFPNLSEPDRNKSANIDEYKNYRKLVSTLSFYSNIFIPEMRLLKNNILATQYIKGTHPENDCWGNQHSCNNTKLCWYSKIQEQGIESRLSGLRDISAFNVVVTENDELYVIDVEF